jgi:SRSO17 transposase
MIAVTLWLEGFAAMTTPREPHSTISFVDQYCSAYRHLFADVRTFECFKNLQLGLISEVKRKTLPAIAKAVGADAQALHHFLVNSPWSAKDFREQRITLTKQALNGRAITVCIDDTGDRKKGEHTDYVSRQYIGNIGKIDNGIVSVHAFGLLNGVTFPLLFEVFKPEKKLKEGERHKSKPKIAVELIQQLCESGFSIGLILAGSHYGESSDFVEAVRSRDLHFVVGIRSNHPVLMLKGWHKRRNPWKKFGREFGNGEQEVRHVREIIYGMRRRTRYYQMTTDKEALPEESTWYVMTNLPGKIGGTVGNLYGDRTWIEAGFRNAKSEPGWSDYKLTDYAHIEKWWEMVCSAYLSVSLRASAFKGAEIDGEGGRETGGIGSVVQIWSTHKWWDGGTGWKNAPNNMRLLIRPCVCLCLLWPWLELLGEPDTGLALQRLIEQMNGFRVFLQV